jgi:hypothetical protein
MKNIIPIKDLRKTNSGNRTPRSEAQRTAALKRMLLDNPMKKPTNRIKKSMWMWGNQFWKLRKKELIKQQPSPRLGMIKEGN